jgi:hypothetical protein
MRHPAFLIIHRNKLDHILRRTRLLQLAIRVFFTACVDNKHIN